jgi:lysophospholipase L1-like esterase
MAKQIIPGAEETRWGDIRAIIAEMFDDLYDSVNLTFNPATHIKFDINYQFNEYSMGANFAIVPDLTNAVALRYNEITLVGDGTARTITFTGMTKIDGSGDLSFTLNKKNKIKIWYDGTVVWYYIYAIQAIASVPFSGLTGVALDNTDLASELVKRPQTYIGENLFDYTAAGIIRGKYLDSSNAEVVFSNTSISDYIPVLPNVAYICNKWAVGVTRNVWYDSSKAVISNFAAAFATSPSNAAYVRFSLNLTAAADISIANIKVERGVYSKVYVPFERRMLEANLPATALTTSNILHGANLYNYLTATSGKYVVTTDGTLGDSGAFFASDFIPVLPSTDYSIKVARQRVFYDVNKQFISGVDASINDLTVTSPVNATYMRFSDVIANLKIGQVAQSSTAVNFQPYKSSLLSFYDNSHNWASKKWGALGTSITAATLWAGYVSGHFDFALTNCGISGTRMAGAAISDSMWQDARVNAIPSDATLVTIEAGTNDWANNHAIGTLASTNMDEFLGAYNTCITKLLTRNPLYRIVIITTPYGHYTAFAGNNNKNASNLGPEDYSQACRDIAKKWGIPVCDLQQDGGWNSLNYTSYLSDDLHPNTLGSRRIADILIGRLAALRNRYEGL